MKISPSALQKASNEFQAASRESDELMDKLEKVMKNLEATWEDAGQQVFFKYYQEWHRYAGSISQLLNLTADELSAMAERFIVADGELPSNNVNDGR